MRIASGKLKGASLILPKKGIKPTSDKVRQALASRFRAELSQLRVADLYCGAGGVGLELLSNGAAFCLFVENASITYGLLKKNLESLVEPERYATLKHAVQTLDPERIVQKYGKFDLIFADPFYRDATEHFESLQRIASSCLNPGGTFVLEHQSKDSLENRTGFQGSKKYGDTTLSFFQ